MSKRMHDSMDDAARLVEVERQLAARDEAIRQFRSVPFKRSRFEALERELAARADVPGLAALNAEWMLAEREGRAVDDVSATIANLKSRGVKGPVLGQGGFYLLQCLARSLGPDYSEAVIRVHDDLIRRGAWAGDSLEVGELIREALPDWAPRDFGGLGARIVPEGATDQVLTARQRRRWVAWRAAWVEALEHVRKTGKLPDDMPEAMGWEPPPSPAETFHYEDRTRGLERWAKERARAALAEKRKTADAVFRTENEGLVRRAES